jgi:hypothetical protein
VITFGISNLNLPEGYINYTLIGNLSTEPIKKDWTLAKLATRHTIRELFPNIAKASIAPLMKAYAESFVALCIVRDKNGNALYN